MGQLGDNVIRKLFLKKINVLTIILALFEDYLQFLNILAGIFLEKLPEHFETSNNHACVFG